MKSAVLATLFAALAVAAVCVSADGAVNQFTFDAAAAMKACNTHFYRGADGKPTTNPVVMRIGCKFTVAAKVDAAAGVPQVLAYYTKQQPPQANGVTSKATKTADGSYTVEVTLGDPAKQETPVGEYGLSLVSAAGKVLWTYPATLFIFYNPYDPTSLVYIADQYVRKELVELENGAMWVGSGEAPAWSPWAFNQFDFNVWSVSAGLLAKLSLSSAKDHVKAVRELAGMISKEVLIGRWGDGPWADADTVPWQWASSSAIFKVVKENKRPAKYGQCMIFSMVTASALRAVGIAAQSNTGYDFVQEKGGDMTVRIYWKMDPTSHNYVWDTAENDKNGEKLWNFHAWSLAHISRPDLGSKEVSLNIVDGTWHAGPGRVSDFRAKDLAKPFDLSAYNPSINSKIIYLNKDPKTGKYLEWPNPFIPANRIQTTQVERPNGCGRKVDVTGSFTAICGEDLVGKYKAVVPKPENRPASAVPTAFNEIASAFRKRNRMSAGERERPLPKGLPTFVSYMPTSTRLGNDFTVSFGPKGRGGAAATPNLKVVARVALQTYDGQTLSEIKSGSDNGNVRVQIRTADFARVDKKHIAASSFVVAHFSVFDAAGSLLVFEERKMAIVPPKINMLCGSKTVKLGNKLNCNINFFNPLPFDITVTLDLLISGNHDPTFMSNTITIPAKTVGAKPDTYRGWFRNVQYKTNTVGKHMVIASLKSPFLNEVKGASVITVTP